MVNMLDISQEQIQFMHKTGDQFVSLPPPSGALLKKGQKQSGPQTFSIDRTSQHMKITQNLAKELEQKYSFRIK